MVCVRSNCNGSQFYRRIPRVSRRDNQIRQSRATRQKLPFQTGPKLARSHFCSTLDPWGRWGKQAAGAGVTSGLREANHVNRPMPAGGSSRWNRARPGRGGAAVGGGRSLAAGGTTNEILSWLWPCAWRCVAGSEAGGGGVGSFIFVCGWAGCVAGLEHQKSERRGADLLPAGLGQLLVFALRGEVPRPPAHAPLFPSSLPAWVRPPLPKRKGRGVSATTPAPRAWPGPVAAGEGEAPRVMVILGVGAGGKVTLGRRDGWQPFKP